MYEKIYMYAKVDTGGKMTAIEQEAERLKLLDPIRKENRIGTGRQALMEAVHDPNFPMPTLREAFDNLSDEERKAGLLIGKLLGAKGNQQVEDAFAWFSLEHNDGVPITDFSKTLALTSAIQTIVGPNPDGYRVLRQVLVKLNTK
jgi:hypothetical protein